jgi:hypothetical protein
MSNTTLNMSLKPSNTTRRVAAGLLAAASLALLGGCGTMNSVSADVSSFGQWPEGRAPSRYAFERLPSQQANPDFQSRVEAAARPALARKGFVAVDTPEQAEVLVQVAAQARTVQSPYYSDPWGRRYDGRFFGGLGFGGLWGGRGGLGFGMNFEPPISQMQVDVLIRDKRNTQTLYETHAVHQRAGGIIESLLAPLFDAALKDFPARAISPRVVTVPIDPDGDDGMNVLSDPLPPTSSAATPVPKAVPATQKP